MVIEDGWKLTALKEKVSIPKTHGVAGIINMKNDVSGCCS